MKLTFSESNKEGRILPKQKEAVVAFMFSLDAKQRDQFRNIINSLPTKQIFGELGDGGTTETTTEGVAKEVDTAVKDAIKASEGTLTYSAALLKVFSEKPNLKSRYEAALGESSN